MPTDNVPAAVIAGEPLAEAAKAIRHRTLDERIEIGHAQAKVLPLEQIGDPPSRDGRPDIIETLRADAEGRIAELLPLRHARMAVSPLATLRGTAGIMAADLASRPSSDLIVQLCGDAHLSNFGIYASPERVLVFDVNDFDETHPGPFEWDVLRLATSFVSCMHDQGDAEKAGTLARHVATAYREMIKDLSERSTLDALYEKVTEADIEALAESSESAATVKDAEETLERARRRTQERAIARLTEEVDGVRRFLSKPPTLVRCEDESIRSSFHLNYAAYIETLPPECQAIARRYTVIDFAMKVVGVGSIGTYCWVVLLEGRDNTDQLILQLKQATPSVLARHVKCLGDFPRIDHEGERIVRGQKMMQAVSDLFLGWMDGVPGTNRQYYARQLHDMKGQFNVDNAKFATITTYADLCARTLARSHARSGDAVAIAAYLGDDDTFADAVEVFSLAESHFVDGDHHRLTEAIAAGDLPAAESEDL
jgi:uncharacterized protein (DUF2252 family)